MLIYGATGYLAEELIKRLYPRHRLTCVARNEGKLCQLQEEYPDISVVSGDISDQFTIAKTMTRAGVYHLAALKGVDMGERQPRECIKTNILGTLNILEQSLISKPEFVLGVSTDKAAQVKGVYGATKLCMERLYWEYGNLNPDTRYRIVRYGNVLGSTSSFLTKWIPKLIRHEKVLLTDPAMTRFFWTVQDGVDHIERCLAESVDATPYVPRMRAMAMGTVLEACMEVYGKAPVTIVGNRGGENLHETVDGITFSNEAEQWTKEDFKQAFLHPIKSNSNG